MLQEQSSRMAEWRVRAVFSYRPVEHGLLTSHNHRETNLDDVLQISNVFVNVSKGQVAPTEDLKKAFGTTEVNDIVKEVSRMCPLGTLFPP